MRFLIKVAPLLLAWLLSAGAAAAQQADTLPVVPRPQRMESGAGSFVVSASVRIVAEAEGTLNCSPSARPHRWPLTDRAGS